MVAAILSGKKTATSSLLIEYGEDELPAVGKREVVVDSSGRAVAVIEVTSVDVVRLAEVDDQFARDEGEGFGGYAAWRVAHEAFWHSNEIRAELGDPTFAVTDDTQVVRERFRLVQMVSTYRD